MTMMTTRDDVRAANGRADDAANNSTGRSGNYSAGAGADGNAFKRTGLRGERKSSKR
jgi:hypothetical protein